MLLLPLEAHSASEPIMLEILMDDVVYWDSVNRDVSTVTLSRLRGTMAEYVVSLSFCVILSEF
jgi:hypothetical protein